LDAVIYEALKAFNAQLDVPYSDPVIEPLTDNEPVIECILLALSFSLLLASAFVLPAKRLISSALPLIVPIIRSWESVNI
jgi:hypothetical protein